LKIEGNHVATVGKINAMPGAYNNSCKVVTGFRNTDLSEK
jgi:hypothetical protein